jgi:hypothetical protein
MMQFGTSLLFAGLAFFLAATPGTSAQTANEPPDFREVYELVRSNLVGVSEADLNREALQALISALGSRVSIEPSGQASSVTNSGALVTRTNLFDGGIAYVRVGQVGDGLSTELSETYQQFQKIGPIKGLVLDLRYTDGEDYAAAAAAAEIFLKTERPLLDWGKGLVNSSEKTNGIAVPVAVLINKQTSRASEALAAVLRQTGAALLLGSRTAGESMVPREFMLKTGQRLRVASVPVRLGDGTTLKNGVKPDISVEVPPHDERLYFTDSFKEIARTNAMDGELSSTNASSASEHRRTRLNEAELVRERREGALPDDAAIARGLEPEVPTVRDPALARALDVLKGLALVRQSRS